MATPQEFSEIPDGWDKWFPEKIDGPPDSVFELGLVLGGTVSAGAYTAGVIDFLIEALDTWADHRNAQPSDPSTPSWETHIKAISGTSGGGVIAAILGRALSFKFPPVRKSSSVTECRQNPLYRIWVEQLDITKMLGLDDLNRGKRFMSLLNPKPLEDGRDAIAQYGQNFSTASPLHRSYVPEPLPILLTLSNLRGIPYRLDMGHGRSQSYVDHADYVRMAVFTRGGQVPLRPDEFGVSDMPGADGFIGWADFAGFALGTAAYPAGFPLRPLCRPLSHYRYRPVAVPCGIPGKRPVQPLAVDWDALLDSGSPNLLDTYHFLAADGGMTDNEPIELCRKVISGWVGHNPRDGHEAKRAVLLVDPFAAPPALGPQAPSTLGASLGFLIGAWKDQARYDSRDLMLAADQNCFSRFMITAQRPGAELGAKSIATASAYAFGGFLSEAFRRHDFFLGRANCQAYLRDELLLPSDNQLFAQWRRAAGQYFAKWEVKNGSGSFLPIIPLLDTCRNDEQTEPYPVDAFNVRSRAFQQLLEGRIAALLDGAKDDFGTTGLEGFFINLYLSIGIQFGKGMVQDKVTEYLEHSLKEWELL